MKEECELESLEKIGVRQKSGDPFSKALKFCHTASKPQRNFRRFAGELPRYVIPKGRLYLYQVVCLASMGRARAQARATTYCCMARISSQENRGSAKVEETHFQICVVS